MINYNDIKVTAVTTEKDYYDSKKKKRIKYKKPKVTKKLLSTDSYAYDLGELYEIIRFYTEKHSGYQTECEITFRTNLEY
tara:strand:- start:459 stop:698 length:240 start_codon:yes stop_codon:yes gene_type:complete